MRLAMYYCIRQCEVDTFSLVIGCCTDYGPLGVERLWRTGHAGDGHPSSSRVVDVLEELGNVMCGASVDSIGFMGSKPM